MAPFAALITSCVLIMPFISKGKTFQVNLSILAWLFITVDGRKCYDCIWTDGADQCQGFTSATITSTCTDTDYCLTIYGNVNGTKASIHQCDGTLVKWIEESNLIACQRQLSLISITFLSF